MANWKWIGYHHPDCDYALTGHCRCWFINAREHPFGDKTYDWPRQMPPEEWPEESWPIVIEAKRIAAQRRAWEANPQGPEPLPF